MNDKYKRKLFLKGFSRISILLIVTLLGLPGCETDPDHTQWQGEASERNRVIMDDYPVVYQDLIYRSGSDIFEHLGKRAPEASGYAWKALFHSDLSVDEKLLELLKDKDREEGWMMLGYHDVESSLLNRIENWWEEGAIDRGYACRALGELGGPETLEMLLSHEAVLTADPDCALAAGRIVSTQRISERLKTWISRTAFESDETEIQVRLLYGFYRNEEARPESGSPAYRLIREGWINTGPQTDPYLDQYAVRILGTEAFRTVMDERGVNLYRYPHLATELARSFENVEWTDDDARQLLTHSHPHVVTELFGVLLGMDEIPESLLEFIQSEFVSKGGDGGLFVEGLYLLQANGMDIHEYLHRADREMDANPYLAEWVLRLYAVHENGRDYLDRIDSMIGEHSIPAYHAMRALVEFAENLEAGNEFTEKITELFWKGAESGSAAVLQAVSPLITKNEYVPDEHFERLMQAMETYSFRDHHRLYEILAENLAGRFDHQAEPFIMSMAEFGYRSVNEKLREAGWQVPEQMDREPAPFREPDWEVLYEMGTRPHWVLETDAGRIVVAMDPLSAPATVSSIDSLTRAGAYNGISFHRVVPNFVIQGGDVSGGSGIGGPGYQVPIEPSVKSFERGMAGIASSGPDTEGSQFFFMNQLAPHLDGRYTIFGEVVEGMDVADQIRVGDKLIRAYIRLE